MGICLIIKSGSGIDTSNATATADKILSGYTVYVNDNKVTGSMFNVANQCKTDTTWGNTSGTYTFVPGTVGGVWGGYHDGTCVMQAATLASQTDCDIPNQWWCLTGYSYWAKGVKYDGAMVVRGTKTWTIGANGTQTIEEGWHDGNGYVNQNIPIDSGEWGPTPTTTNQQLCRPGWYYSANRWCWGNANLIASNIKSGVSIFGVTGNYVETKRYLIQNGAYTSIAKTHLFTATGSTPSSTSTTYNNATWKLLVDYSYNWVDKDEGGWTQWDRYTIVPSIGSIVTITSNTYIGCKIHGDILCYGWSDSGALHKTYQWYIMFGLGGYSRAATSNSTNWAASPWVDTIPAFSNGIRYSGMPHSKVSSSDLVIDATFGYSGNSYGFSVYAKNLWLETTESVSWTG